MNDLVKQTVREQCQRDGLAKVKAKLANSDYPANEEEYVLEWVIQQDQIRQDDRHAQNLRAAENRNDVAGTANHIARQISHKQQLRDWSGQMAKTPVDKRPDLALEYLIDMICDLTGIDRAELNGEKFLARLEVDSLAAVEIRLQIENDWGVDLPVTDLLGRNALGSLAERLAEIVAMQESQKRGHHV